MRAHSDAMHCSVQGSRLRLMLEHGLAICYEEHFILIHVDRSLRLKCECALAAGHAAERR